MTPPGMTWERREAESDVLIVANTWPHDDQPAYGIFVERQVDSLVRAGLRCDVLFLRGYRSPWNYLRAAFWFARKSRAIRRSYRLIHAHAGETGLAASFAVGTPLLVSYQGDDLLGNPSPDGRLTRQSRIRSWLIRQHSRLLAATITKSAEMEFVLPTPVARRNLVVPNGVDIRLFRPIERAEARERLGWDDVPVALFCATKPETPRKRLWLAEAARAEAGRMLGRGVRLEVAGRVPPDQMPAMMSAADCLLMTSSMEGSPNTVKEALMCNLPVVATPAGDIEELLEGVTPSWLCEAQPEALGMALADCIASGERSNGRDAARRLADGTIAERVLEAYRSLAGIELDSNGSGYAQPMATETHASR